jgi:hypothetical protein
MTYHCTDCDVRWWPYQTKEGVCLRCGSGTRRTQEGPSPNVAVLYRSVVSQRKRIELYDRFEEYYLQRELARGPDAWRTP